MINIDETLWVALSITIFLLLFYRYCKKPILNILDSRAKLINDKILEAESLLDAAKNLLAYEKEQHKIHYQEAEENVNNIENEITAIMTRAENELEDKLSLKQRHLAKIIKDKEKLLVNNLQLEALDIAIEIVTNIVTKQGMEEVRDQILTKSLASLERT